METPLQRSFLQAPCPCPAQREQLLAQQWLLYPQPPGDQWVCWDAACSAAQIHGQAKSWHKAAAGGHFQHSFFNDTLMSNLGNIYFILSPASG